MKRFFTISLLMVSAVFWMANSDGRASSQNSGNTGAPGDETIAGVPRTCQTCHSTSTDLSTVMSLSVKDGDGNEVSNYIPGTVYRVRVSHTATGSPDAYGFQMVALVDSDNSDVAGFSNPTGNTQIATAIGRQYIEQNGPSTESFFEADWTAPAVGSGDVTFYFAGNAVDGNNMNSGDGADAKSLTITESSTSFVNSNSFERLNIFPNPSNGIFEVEGIDLSNASFQLYSLLGSKLTSQKLSNQIIDLRDFSNGVYLLRIDSSDQSITRKVQIIH